MKIVWDSVAEELFPILPSFSGPGWETLNFIDYAPSSIVKRLRVMSDLATEQLPATLTYTLHDDNVGFMPQLTLDSLHKISTQIRHFGWAGYSTRYWQIGDHDPSIAYMAKVAWDPSSDPERICSDLAEAICGPESVDDLLDVWREVQEATVTLEQHALGLAFPTPRMLMKHWIPEAFPEPVERVRSAYTRVGSPRQAYGRGVDSAANCPPARLASERTDFDHRLHAIVPTALPASQRRSAAGVPTRLRLAVPRFSLGHRTPTPPACS